MRKRKRREGRKRRGILEEQKMGKERRTEEGRREGRKESIIYNNSNI